MSDYRAPAPLFASPSSVYRRRRPSPSPTASASDDQDEHLVDTSLHSPPQLSSSPSLSPKLESASGTAVDPVDVPLHPPSPPLRSIDEVKLEDEAGLGARGEEKTCRICLGGDEEVEVLGRLISPCLCAGSMRYVHVKCIDAWRGRGANAKAFMECPQCHHQYRLRRTLISGLATSRPLLLLLSSIFFLTLTFLSGSLMHYILVSRSSSSSDTSSDVLADDGSSFTSSMGGSVYTTSGGSVIVFTGPHTLLLDLLSSALDSSASLAVELADLLSDLPEPLADTLWFFGVRLLLGLAVMGSISFMSLVLSLSLFAPIQILATMRGTGWFQNISRRYRRGAARGAGLGEIAVVLFLVIGIANSLVQSYGAVKSLTQYALRWVETSILEVNPEDQRRAKEESERRRTEGWRARWWREKRWRTRAGWWEVWIRFWVWVKVRGGEGVRALKERWRRGVEVEA